MTAVESLTDMVKDIKRLAFDTWAFRMSFVEYRIIAWCVALVGVSAWIAWLYFTG